MEKKLILEATETSNAVYLLETYRGGAAFEVAGQRHYLTWDQLEGLSAQGNREAAAQYRSMLVAARNAGSMGGSGTVESRIRGLITEARGHRDRGNTAQAGECIRTLDDLIGGWVDGVFVGGAELVRGRVSVETAMAVRFGPRDQAWREMLGARLRASPAAEGWHIQLRSGERLECRSTMLFTDSGATERCGEVLMGETVAADVWVAPL